MQRAWVRSLVGELRSHMPHGTTKEKIIIIIGFNISLLFFFFGGGGGGPEILVPQPEIEPRLLTVKHRILTTGLPARKRLFVFGKVAEAV